MPSTSPPQITRAEPAPLMPYTSPPVNTSQPMLRWTYVILVPQRYYRMGSPSLSYLLMYTCQPAVMATRSVNEPGSTERNPSSLQTPTESASRTATQNAATPETRVQSLPSHPAPMGARVVRQHDLSPHSALTAQPNLPAPSLLPVEAAPANGSANVPNGNGQYKGVAK